VALAVCALLATPAFAAAGDSFQTAIRLTPQPGDERGSPIEDFKYTDVTIEEFEQSVYFVFTAANSNNHMVYWKGSLRFDIYDGKQNLIHENINTVRFETKAGDTYYVRVTYGSGQGSFNRDAPINAEIGILAFTPETQLLPPFVWIALFLGFLVVVAFPYRRYMLRKYDFDPIERKPFLFSFALATVYMALEWFMQWGPMWPLVAAMAPAFIITSLKLLSITREPKILAVNTALMLGFYSMMGFIAGLFFLVVVIIMIAFVVFGGMRGALSGGGRGGRTCRKYGRQLGSSLYCGCGGHYN